jgi:predicted kinase
LPLNEALIIPQMLNIINIPNVVYTCCMQAIIGIGIPGSGKTTLLRPLAKKLGLSYINRDDIRLALTGDPTNHSREPAVTKLMYQRIAEGLHANGVIVDATHSRLADRRQVIEFCREHGAATITAYWVNVPLETALLRNRGRDRKVPDHVLAAMQNRLELNPPTLAEGFDDITEITD